MIGRDGKLMAYSLGPVTSQGNFSDRDFFRAHADNSQDRLFISQPIAGRTSGRWSELFTRRIAAADGWFHGDIAASVDPAWLMRLHRSLDIGQGTVMLVGANGRIRALARGSGSDPTRGIGGTVDLAGVLDMTEQPDRVTLNWANPVDGTPQIVSFQRLADNDAYVIVGWCRRLAPPALYRVQAIGIITLLILVASLLLINAPRAISRPGVARGGRDRRGIVMVDARGRSVIIAGPANYYILTAVRWRPFRQPAGYRILNTDDAD